MYPVPWKLNKKTAARIGESPYQSHRYDFLSYLREIILCKLRVRNKKSACVYINKTQIRFNLPTR